VKKLFFALALISLALHAQIQVRNDVVLLSEGTALSWDRNPEPDIAGYLVQLQQGTNIWTRDVGNTNRITVFELSNVTIPNGTYTGRVAAYNTAGLLSEYSSTSTNLFRKPGNARGVKFNP
jgi:hypothetical protein